MIRDGRLGKGFDKEVARYTSSIQFDAALFEYDLLNDMAHLVMLEEQEIVDRADAKLILKAVKEIEKGGMQSIELTPEYEDVHMAIEHHILKVAGEVGGKLHTARSRNDQVATDLRMKTRSDLILLWKAAIGLQNALLELAEKHTLTLIPSYTHLQQAQPTTLAHHLLAYADSLGRTMERFGDAYNRLDLCPLGAGAATSTSFPIKRERTAELLGFKGLLENTMDAVSSRDYMGEIASAAALLAVDLSRMAEEFILWSTTEFGYIELSDDVASTSSIMPQKKNPDVLEVLRARTGAMIGGLTSIFTMLRSLPQSYNRDLQEVSPIFFKLMEDSTHAALLVGKVVSTIKVNKDRMNSACISGFSTATELADLIVKNTDLPFRTAHRIVGESISSALKEGLGKEDITAGYLDRIAKSLTGKDLGLSDELITEALTPLVAVQARKAAGGPAPEVVEKMIKSRFDRLAVVEQDIGRLEKGIRDSEKMLRKIVDEIIG